MNRWMVSMYILFAMLLLAGIEVVGQPSKTDSLFNNQDAFKVTVRQPFSFGVYSQGNAGGDIEILPDGSRRVTGTLLPLNFGSTYSPLVLEIEAPKGAIISFYNNGNSVLTGSNGGRMLLKMGNTNPESPFYIAKERPEKTYVNIGGVLSVGNAATTPAGTYSGNIYISFVIE